MCGVKECSSILLRRLCVKWVQSMTTLSWFPSTQLQKDFWESKCTTCSAVEPKFALWPPLYCHENLSYCEQSNDCQGCSGLSSQSTDHYHILSKSDFYKCWYFESLISLWLEFACPANQHLKSTINKKKRKKGKKKAHKPLHTLWIFQKVSAMFGNHTILLFWL